jgi:large subunit ribosomal protein L13
VVNAAKTVLTGNKEHEKTYYRTTTRPGSIRAETAEKKRQRLPTRLIESAVFGMLPKGPLGRRIRKKLKVYAGPEHPHQAQQPQTLDLGLAAKA